jgi:hypothetical protein
MKSKKSLQKKESTKKSAVNNDSFESSETEIVFEPIDSATWWMVGKRGTILGCGNLQGTALPNKTTLYTLTAQKFMIESYHYGTKFFNFYKRKN